MDTNLGRNGGQGGYPHGDFDDAGSQGDGIRVGLLLGIGLGLLMFLLGVTVAVVLYSRRIINLEMLKVSLLVPLVTYVVVAAVFTWTKGDDASCDSKYGSTSRGFAAKPGFDIYAGSRAQFQSRQRSEVRAMKRAAADTFVRKLMDGILSKDGFIYALVGFALPLGLLLWWFSTSPLPNEYPMVLRSLLFPRG